MTVEYVLLIALFVFLFMGAIINGPKDAFKKAGPKLAARIEQNLMTGVGWRGQDNAAPEWKKRP